MDAPVKKTGYPWYVRVIIGRNPFYTLFRALVWAVFLLVMFKVVFLGIRVRGQSMEPNFHDGQIHVINRLAYLRHPPKRGDVVSFRADEYNALILKRIVALPGETVSIHRGGEIFINGKHLEEPYATVGHTTYPPGMKTLEPHQYFLFGDNRGVSEAYFKYDYQIIGKVVF